MDELKLEHIQRLLKPVQEGKKQIYSFYDVRYACQVWVVQFAFPDPNGESEYSELLFEKMFNTEAAAQKYYSKQDANLASFAVKA